MSQTVGYYHFVRLMMNDVGVLKSITDEDRGSSMASVVA